MIGKRLFLLLHVVLLLGACSDNKSPAEQTDAEVEALRQKLESLGYVGVSEQVATHSGVTVHDRSRAHEGYNFYTSGDEPKAVLMDMEGRVIHSWSRSFADTFPDYRSFWQPGDPLAPVPGAARFWRHAELLPDGSIVAIFEGIGIVKLDRDSNVVWRHQNQAHHDLAVLADGGVMTLTRQAHVVPSASSLPILEDYVTVLDANGDEIARHSVLQMFENSRPDFSWRALHQRFWAAGDQLDRRKNWPTWTRQDIFHTNSIQVIDTDWVALPEFRAGRVLTSFRNLDTVALLDLEAGKVVWAQTGPFREQHDPGVVGDGRIIVFNNFAERDRSSIMMIDLAARRTVWEYPGTAPEVLFTRGCGSSQPLSNGNVLVTETEGSRALEITPEGQVVWEFHNPARAGPQRDRASHIFDMVRLESGSATAWRTGD